MSIPTVTNFDETKIPVEGSADFRANASYVWGKIVDVIKSINASIAGINVTANDVTAKHDEVVSKVNAVAPHYSNIDNVASNSDNVKTVANNTDNMTLLALNITSIKTNAENIQAITDATSSTEVLQAEVEKTLRRAKAKDFGISL